MGDATHFVTRQDKAIEKEVVEEMADPTAQVTRTLTPFEEGLPTPFPVNGRWRPL
ncbi:MAG: hypothetical protein M5U34_06810 [Chloroflexi bacterium]|nr:hypothetical protein [Chloroflexota bacterium]